MKNKMKLLLRDAFLSTILSSVIIFLLALIIFNIRYFNPLHKAFKDFSFLDVYYAEGFHDTDKINTNIILINIQDKNRLEIAQLLESVINADPNTIGIDIVFKDRKENQFADSLLASLLNNKKIITAYDIGENTITYNHPFFGETDKKGFVNFNFDNETVIRKFIGKVCISNKEHLSFASQITKNYLKDKWKTYGYDCKLAQLHTIKYQGHYDSFQYLDFDDFFNSDKKNILKNKIVILGYLGNPIGSKTDIEDKFFSPLNKVYAGKSNSDMFGTVIHANIINMLINNDFMTTISNSWLVSISFLMMFLSTIYYMRTSRKNKISYRTRKHIYQLVLSSFILGLSLWLYKHNVVLKPSIIIVGIVLSGSYFKYYKHFTRYIKSKTNLKWKTYLK